jgi:hypothetical protein
MIGVCQVNRGYENNRRVLAARMLPNHACQFKPANFRHTYVHEDDRNIHLEKMFKSFGCRMSLDEIFAQLIQHQLISEQLRGLVVHHENVHFVVLDAKWDKYPVIALDRKVYCCAPLSGVQS